METLIKWVCAIDEGFLRITSHWRRKKEVEAGISLGKRPWQLFPCWKGPCWLYCPQKVCQHIPVFLPAFFDLFLAPQPRLMQRVAVLFLPFPDPLQEFFPAQVVMGQPFVLFNFLFHFNLGCQACVVEAAVNGLQYHSGAGTDIIRGSHSFPVIVMSKGAELKIKIIISKYICKNWKYCKKIN